MSEKQISQDHVGAGTTTGTDDMKVNKEMSEIERAMSPGDLKDHQDYSRIDKEVAKYTGEAVFVSEEDDKRLRKMIDRRVLVIMVLTYLSVKTTQLKIPAYY